jgi:polyisoprenoid-binding protein YceI
MQFFRLLVFATLTLALAATPALPAEAYTVDPDHSSVSFMTSHLGLTQIHGRFNEFSGSFTIDKDNPAKSSFALSIKVESVDTNNKKRDAHLRSPDFFEVKKYPLMTFQSTSVRAVAGGYAVTGDLTLHGVKKSVTLTLLGGKTVEFPKGKGLVRTGFTTSTVLKRSDYDMKTGIGLIGDEVTITIGLEGVKK